VESSFFAILGRLNPVSASVLAIAGMLTLWITVAKKVHVLMFLITLSAAFVGSTMPVVDNVAYLLRWLSILALLVSGLLLGRMKLSFGLLMFWGYVLLGFAFLLRSYSISWQFQRSSLLILVALAITTAYSINTPKAYKKSLVWISVAASVFSIVTFVPLMNQLTDAARYSGYSKGAPVFAACLGALLPFAFWGLWQAEAKLVRIACGAGFLLGATSLILSGQRAGVAAGLLGVIPLILAVAGKKRKAAAGATLLVILAILLIGFLFDQSSAGRRDFLVSRYSIDYGLSGRDWIWEMAMSRIAEDPFLGRGMGATDVVSSYSFHNTYLEVWFTTGLLGLVLFVASQLYFLYRTIRLSRMTKDAEIKSVLALALGYMLGFIALSTVESAGAGASNINVILYLFLGILVSSDWLLNSATSQQVGDLRQEESHSLHPMKNLSRGQELGGQSEVLAR